MSQRNNKQQQSKFDERWGEEKELPGEVHCDRCAACDYPIKDHDDSKIDEDGNVYHEECYNEYLADYRAER